MAPSDDESDDPREPGSPGVVGEHPNRADAPAEADAAALDEHPDGMHPGQSDPDHWPEDERPAST
jgi:hypothetical protein